jgi:hypothetical protein
MAGMSWFSFPKRISPIPIIFRMIGFHLPPIRFMVLVTGQSNGFSIYLIKWLPVGYFDSLILVTKV